MIEQGQELWFVPSRRRASPYIATVLKVGRKWAELDDRGLRIDVETLWADGGQYSSPGRAWLSKEAWEEEVERNKAWDRFTTLLRHKYSVPDHLTTEDIIGMIRKLQPAEGGEPRV